MKVVFRQSGFTIMEAIIVIAIVAVMFVMISQFFLGGNQTYRNQTAELNINYYARMALDDIDSFVRQSSQPLASHDIYTAGTTTLILEVQAVNSSNQLIAGVNDYVVYYLTGTDLYRKIYAGTGSIRAAGTRLMASSVIDLEFILNNANYTQVSEITTEMTVQENTGRELRTLDISTKSRIRN